MSWCKNADFQKTNDSLVTDNSLSKDRGRWYESDEYN